MNITKINELFNANLAKSWWKNTDEYVKQQIYWLGKNPVGEKLLYDLSNFNVTKDADFPLEIIKLKQILRAPYTTEVFVFEVFDKQGQITYTHEWSITRQGFETGAKGVIILENNLGEAKVIGCLETYKFASSRFIIEAVGGYAKENESSEDTMRREVEAETGISGKNITKIESLGKVYVDAGFTPKRIPLFAIYVRDKNLLSAHDNFDTREFSKVRFYTIRKFKNLVESGEIQDSFLLAIFAKLSAKNKFK